MINQLTRRSILFGGAASVFAQQQQTPNQPGTKWSEEQLREAIVMARVGRKLTPKSWPKGSRVAVCLSFDTDTEAPLLRDGNTSPTTLSASEFGAASGMPRILKMLDRHAVPASFFMTGVDAMLHPEMVAGILKSGRHEIGVHGWIHEFTPRLASEAEEERLLDQSIDLLTKAAGKRPVGYRAPSWAFSPYTLDLIRRKGFLYDSSLQALDEPYEIVSKGKPTGLIELAIDWTLTETPYLGRDGHMPSPRLLYELYKGEFDGAYEERTMFILTLHPYISGHRAPMEHLDRFVAYMKSKPGVWFATCAQIAQYLKDQNPLLLSPDVPEMNRRAPDVFTAHFETTKGAMVLEFHRDWSPAGVDHFYNLALAGYYDDTRIYRVIKDRWAQFGIHGDPAVSRLWRERTIPDEPRKQSNTHGMVAYAFASANGRTTQLFINLKDNSATHDREPFVPIAKVVEGMEVAHKFYADYGETSGGGIRSGKQTSLFDEGNAFLDRNFPKLDHIVRLVVRDRR